MAVMQTGANSQKRPLQRHESRSATDLLACKLTSHLVRMTKCESAGFHLLLRVIFARFTRGQTGQSYRQRHQIEKFAISTLLLGDTRISTRHRSDSRTQTCKTWNDLAAGSSNTDESRRKTHKIQPKFIIKADEHEQSDGFKS